MKRVSRRIQHGKIKGWDKTSLKQLMKRLVKYDTMSRQKGSGHPQTSTTHENEETVNTYV